MRITHTMELTEEEMEVVKLADALRSAVEQSNRAGVGQWKYLADGVSENGMYKRIDNLYKEVMYELFCSVLSTEQIDVLMDAIMTNGDSVERTITENLWVVYR